MAIPSQFANSEALTCRNPRANKRNGHPWPSSSQIPGCSPCIDLAVRLYREHQAQQVETPEAGPA